MKTMKSSLRPRLILLHAFPLDGRMWDAQLHLLPGRTEAPTLYGLGETLEAWAAGVLKNAGDGPLILVGASMGGSVALEMARQAGDRVAALVLVGAKAGHRPEPARREAYIAELRSHGVDGLWPEIMAQCFGPRSDQRVIDYVRRIAAEQQVEDLIRAMQVFYTRPDLTEVAAQWKKPILVINGDSGGLEGASRSGASKPASQPALPVHTMRGCAHYMNLENPEEFNQVIAGVIRTVLTSGAGWVKRGD